MNAAENFVINGKCFYKIIGRKMFATLFFWVVFATNILLDVQVTNSLGLFYNPNLQQISLSFYEFPNYRRQENVDKMCLIHAGAWPETKLYGISERKTEIV